MDFKPARQKWKITEDRKYLRIEKDLEDEQDQEEVWYELINEDSREYWWIEQTPIINKQSLMGIIGRLSKKLQLSIGVEEKKCAEDLVVANNEQDTLNNKYSEEIEQVILPPL